MVSSETPMDHTSLFAPCLAPCLKHSGAPKNLVPTNPTSSRVRPRTNAAPPKSTSTALGSTPFSHGRRSITFSGLMSRCTTPTACRNAAAPRSCAAIASQSRASSEPRRAIAVTKSPPVYASVTMCTICTNVPPTGPTVFCSYDANVTGRFGCRPDTAYMASTSSRTRSAERFEPSVAMDFTARASAPKEGGDGEAPSGDDASSRDPRRLGLDFRYASRTLPYMPRPSTAPST